MSYIDLTGHNMSVDVEQSRNLRGGPLSFTPDQSIDPSPQKYSLRLPVPSGLPPPPQG